MSDITHCDGRRDYQVVTTCCPLRHTCRRYTEVRSDWDSWMQAPFDERTGECWHYLEDKK